MSSTLRRGRLSSPVRAAAGPWSSDGSRSRPTRRRSRPSARRARKMPRYRSLARPATRWTIGSGISTSEPPSTATRPVCQFGSGRHRRGPPPMSTPAASRFTQQPCGPKVINTQCPCRSGPTGSTVRSGVGRGCEEVGETRSRGRPGEVVALGRMGVDTRRKGARRQQPGRASSNS